MMKKTHEKTVTFKQPFSLKGRDEVFPAGDYVVETEEEGIQESSFIAHRRVSARLYLSAPAGGSRFKRSLSIDPEILDEAIKRDQAFQQES